MKKHEEDKRPKSRPVEPGDVPIGREEERRGHDLPHHGTKDEPPIGEDRETRQRTDTHQHPRP